VNDRRRNASERLARGANSRARRIGKNDEYSVCLRSPFGQRSLQGFRAMRQPQFFTFGGNSSIGFLAEATSSSSWSRITSWCLPISASMFPGVTKCVPVLLLTRMMNGTEINSLCDQYCERLQ
jgi:hypothetical protein